MSTSPVRKKQKQHENSATKPIRLQDLPVHELGIIYSFLCGDNDDSNGNNTAHGRRWPSTLRPLFCREWSKVSRTFAVSTPEHYSALAFCPVSLPRRIDLLSLPDHVYSSGTMENEEVTHEDQQTPDQHDISHEILMDPQYISRFVHLRHLCIQSAQMKGGYPLLFRFANLRTLTIMNVPHLEFHLDGLSDMPLLEAVRFTSCDRIKGGLSCFRVLKETLCHLKIDGCKDVTGDFMELSDFPKLTTLFLGSSTSIGGDIMHWKLDHFPALQRVDLPDAVHGWSSLARICDASEIMTSLSVLKRRAPKLFEGHRWVLSENSPDYYESIKGYPAPLKVEFVKEGRSVGWRWTSGEERSYPSSMACYWVVHCETHWIEDPDSRGLGDLDFPFESFVDNCSRHLSYGRMGIPLVPFDGLYEPPSKEQYRLLIQENSSLQGAHDVMSQPDFDIVEFLGEDSPLLARIRSFPQEYAEAKAQLQSLGLGQLASVGDDGYVAGVEVAGNEATDELESGTEVEAAVAVPRLSESQEQTEDNQVKVSRMTRTLIELAKASAEEEDGMSDMIDFSIGDLHTTTDPDQQINIIGTYVLTDRNDDPKLTWRALWSIEAHHDMSLNWIRLKHFHRWPREEVPPNDLYRSEHSVAIYFPGVKASHDAKCCWAGMIMEECTGNIMRPEFDSSWGRDYSIPNLNEASEIISDILVACAPEKLSVFLYIERSMVESFIKLATIQEEDAVERSDFGFGGRMTEEDLEEIRAQSRKSKQNPGLQDIRKFLSSPYLRDDVPSGIKLNADEVVSDQVAVERLRQFKLWMKDEATPGSTLHQEEVIQKLPPRREDKLSIPLSSLRSHRETEDDMLLLARRDDVPKDLRSDDVLDEILSSLGLFQDIVGLHPSCSRNLDVHGCTYTTSDLVGGNIHYPDTNGRTSVAFTWFSTQKLTKELIQKKEYQLAFETEFVRNAKSTQEASNGSSCFILWPKASNASRGSEEPCRRWPFTNGLDLPLNTTAVTSENAYLIWLPGDFDLIDEKIHNHLINGCDGYGNIRLITSHSGNIFWQTLFTYFDNVMVKGEDLLPEEYPTIQNKDCLEFCHLLAITRTLIEADEFFHFTEYTKEPIKEFFDSFSMKWRSILLKSDEILGLGLGMGVQASSASHEGLYLMLEFYQSKFELYLEEINQIDHAEDDEDDIEFAPFPPRNA